MRIQRKKFPITSLRANNMIIQSLEKNGPKVGMKKKTIKVNKDFKQKKTFKECASDFLLKIYTYYLQIYLY